MRSFLRASAWIPLLCGVGLLALAARAGLLPLTIALLPGAMMTAGGMRSLVAPDRLAPQHAALGSALGLVAALPLALAGAPGIGGAAVILAGLSFVASGWLSIAQEPPLAEVPAPPPNPGYAARVALDGVLLSVLNSVNPPASREALRDAVQESESAHALYLARGWLEKPERFHPEPPEIDTVDARPLRIGGLDCEHLRIASGHEPDPDMPGRDRWLGHVENRTAHVWTLRHATPRPWLVCVHGFGMGTPDRDFQAFRARELYEERRLNLAFVALPVHGPRAPGRFSGMEFMGLSPVDFVHAESQAIWDLRRLIRWLRRQEGEPVGVFGISLGGYTTALLAGLEDDLACAIAGVPPSDLVATDERLASDLDKSRQREAGLEPTLSHAIHRVVSPLAMPPRLPREQRFVFAATGDQFVPIEQVRRLWLHWDRPRIAWCRGGHVSGLMQRDSRALVDEAIATAFGAGSSQS